MFNFVKKEGVDVTLSKRIKSKLSLWGEVPAKSFLAYKSGNEWIGLVNYEELEEVKKEQKKINEKIELILKEMGKEYIPKTVQDEPAKLVDTISNLICVGEYVSGISGSTWTPDDDKPEKKKRGRPKGSKTKKK
jgi:hypothetical protein